MFHDRNDNCHHNGQIAVQNLTSIFIFLFPQIIDNKSFWKSNKNKQNVFQTGNIYERSIHTGYYMTFIHIKNLIYNYLRKLLYVVILKSSSIVRYLNDVIDIQLSVADAC